LECRIDMSGEQYREYAAECVRLANEVQDASHKARLLQMAQDWIRLAEHSERPAAPPDK
jgi:hypothetical protein